MGVGGGCGLLIPLCAIISSNKFAIIRYNFFYPSLTFDPTADCPHISKFLVSTLLHEYPNSLFGQSRNP